MVTGGIVMSAYPSLLIMPVSTDQIPSLLIRNLEHIDLFNILHNVIANLEYIDIFNDWEQIDRQRTDPFNITQYYTILILQVNYIVNTITN
jgi:hypothetical protein